MRHSGWTFAQKTQHLPDDFDVIFCTDMLDLCGWKSFAPPKFKHLPTILYFHENQLLYPSQNQHDGDLHFAFSNILNAASADEIWFNSNWHRDSFLHEGELFLRRMPDFSPHKTISYIRQRSHVCYPGFELAETWGAKEGNKNIHYLWAARWEHDKNPTPFVDALKRLKQSKKPFRLSIIGQTKDKCPPIFEEAKQLFADELIHFGWQPDRQSFERVLRSSDVIVSTALHEFFGIAIVEAVAAGAFPLLPKRLAYPEVFNTFVQDDYDDGFYDENLAERMAEVADRHSQNDLWQGDPRRGIHSVNRFHWKTCATAMDHRVSAIKNDT